MEEYVGRNPKTVYAVKVVGVGHGLDSCEHEPAEGACSKCPRGKKHTYIFLHASKVNYDRLVQQLPKGLIGESDTVTTYVGTVEWQETGVLCPEERVIKMPEPKKAKRGRAA